MANSSAIRCSLILATNAWSVGAARDEASKYSIQVDIQFVNRKIFGRCVLTEILEGCQIVKLKDALSLRNTWHSRDSMTVVFFDFQEYRILKLRDRPHDFFQS